LDLEEPAARKGSATEMEVGEEETGRNRITSACGRCAQGTGIRKEVV